MAWAFGNRINNTVSGLQPAPQGGTHAGGFGDVYAAANREFDLSGSITSDDELTGDLRRRRNEIVMNSNIAPRLNLGGVDKLTDTEETEIRAAFETDRPNPSQQVLKDMHPDTYNTLLALDRLQEQHGTVPITARRIRAAARFRADSAARGLQAARRESGYLSSFAGLFASGVRDTFADEAQFASVLAGTVGSFILFPPITAVLGVGTVATLAGAGLTAAITGTSAGIVNEFGIAKSLAAQGYDYSYRDALNRIATTASLNVALDVGVTGAVSTYGYFRAPFRNAGARFRRAPDAQPAEGPRDRGPFGPVGDPDSTAGVQPDHNIRRYNTNDAPTAPMTEPGQNLMEAVRGNQRRMRQRPNVSEISAGKSSLPPKNIDLGPATYTNVYARNLAQLAQDAQVLVDESVRRGVSYNDNLQAAIDVAYEYADLLKNNPYAFETVDSATTHLINQLEAEVALNSWNNPLEFQTRPERIHPGDIEKTMQYNVEDLMRARSTMRGRVTRMRSRLLEMRRNVLDNMIDEIAENTGISRARVERVIRSDFDVDMLTDALNNRVYSNEELTAIQDTTVGRMIMNRIRARNLPASDLYTPGLDIDMRRVFRRGGTRAEDLLNLEEDINHAQIAIEKFDQMIRVHPMNPRGIIGLDEYRRAFSEASEAIRRRQAAQESAASIRDQVNRPAPNDETPVAPLDARDLSPEMRRAIASNLEQTASIPVDETPRATAGPEEEESFEALAGRLLEEARRKGIHTGNLTPEDVAQGARNIDEQLGTTFYHELSRETHDDNGRFINRDQFFDDGASNHPLSLALAEYQQVVDTDTVSHAEKYRLYNELLAMSDRLQTQSGFIPIEIPPGAEDIIELGAPEGTASLTELDEAIDLELDRIAQDLDNERRPREIFNQLITPVRGESTRIVGRLRRQSLELRFVDLLTDPQGLGAILPGAEQLSMSITARLYSSLGPDFTISLENEISARRLSGVDTDTAQADLLYELVESIQDNVVPAEKSTEWRTLRQSLIDFNREQRLAYVRSGIPLRELEGFSISISHDPSLMVMSGRDQWVSDVLPLVDHGYYSQALKNLDIIDYLGNLYDVITDTRELIGQSGPVLLEDTAPIAQGRASIRAITKARGLRLKDGASTVQYLRKYSKKQAAISNHIIEKAELTGGQTALARLFGSDYPSVLETLIVDVQRHAADQGQGFSANRIRTIWRTINHSSHLEPPASIETGFAVLNAIAKSGSLGAIVISGFLDMGSQFASISTKFGFDRALRGLVNRFYGRSSQSPWSSREAVRRGLSDEEARFISQEGFKTEQFSKAIQRTARRNSGIAGMVQRQTDDIAEWLMSVTYANAFDIAQQYANYFDFASNWAHVMATTNYEDLSRAARRVWEDEGLSAADYNFMRQVEPYVIDGVPYLSLSNVLNSTEGTPAYRRRLFESARRIQSTDDSYTRARSTLRDSTGRFGNRDTSGSSFNDAIRKLLFTFAGGASRAFDSIIRLFRQPHDASVGGRFSFYAAIMVPILIAGYIVEAIRSFTRFELPPDPRELTTWLNAGASTGFFGSLPDWIPVDHIGDVSLTGGRNFAPGDALLWNSITLGGRALGVVGEEIGFFERPENRQPYRPLYHTIDFLYGLQPFTRPFYLREFGKKYIREPLLRGIDPEYNIRREDLRNRRLRERGVTKFLFGPDPADEAFNTRHRGRR